MNSSFFPPIKGSQGKPHVGTHYSGTRHPKQKSERVLPKIFKSNSESQILANSSCRNLNPFKNSYCQLCVVGSKVTFSELPLRERLGRFNSRPVNRSVSTIRLRAFSDAKISDVKDMALLKKEVQTPSVELSKELSNDEYKSQIGTKIKDLGLKIMIVEDSPMILKGLVRSLRNFFDLTEEFVHKCESTECVDVAMSNTDLQGQVAFIVLDNNILDKPSLKASKDAREPMLVRSESFYVGAGFGARRAFELQQHFQCPVFGNSADYDGIPRPRSYSEGDVPLERTPENGYWLGVNDRVSKKGQLIELFREERSTALKDIWEHLLRIEASRLDTKK